MTLLLFSISICNAVFNFVDVELINFAGRRFTIDRLTSLRKGVAYVWPHPDGCLYDDYLFTGFSRILKWARFLFFKNEILESSSVVAILFDFTAIRGAKPKFCSCTNLCGSLMNYWC